MGKSGDWVHNPCAGVRNSGGSGGTALKDRVEEARITHIVAGGGLVKLEEVLVWVKDWSKPRNLNWLLSAEGNPVVQQRRAGRNRRPEHLGPAQ